MTAPASDFEQGTIVDVEQVTLGSELSGDAALGAVSVTISDASDFDAEDGGTCVIGGAQYVYTVTDVDGGVLTITPGLTAAGSDGDRVDVLDTVTGQAASYYEALVQLPGDEDVDATPARLASSLVPTFTHKLGIRDAGAGEACTIQLQGDEWVVVEVPGDTVQLDGANIVDGSVSQTSLGFTLPSGTKVTVSTTAPTPAVAGDLWVDAGHGNVLKQFDGSNWNSVQDTAIAAAQSAASAASAAASAAQTTANGRNTIFRQGTAPTAHAAGDVWFDTANGNRVSVWTGTAWQLSQFGNAAVANLDAGSITTGTLAAARIAAASITGDKLVAGTITGDRLVAGTITGDLIAANAIVAGMIATGALDAYQIDAASLSAVTMSGHVIGSTVSGSDFLVDSDAGRVLVYQQAANVVTSDSTPGTSGNTWTVPAGVTSLKIEGWGSGASGCNSASNTAAGAGGGGEYAAEPSITVKQGDVVTWTVPAGGAGGFNTTDGGDAILYVNGVEVLRAHGGKKGTTSGGGKGGTGSTNTIHFDGGKGGNGNGAGGGSSAGTKASGNAGGNGSAYGYSAAPGGAAPTGGGKGGTGGTSSTNGANGNTPGGGGGASGGSSSGSGGSWVSTLAGSGAAGQIQVTYYASTLVASLASMTGTTDPNNPANTIPAGLKVQRQELVGVVGGYATERSFTLNNVSSSGSWSFLGNGSIIKQLSDYGGPFNAGVFTAPTSSFYDASIFVTGTNNTSCEVQVLPASGGSWTGKTAAPYSGSVQDNSCSGAFWLNAGDQVRFAVRQTSGSPGTLTGFFFIGVRS